MSGQVVSNYISFRLQNRGTPGKNIVGTNPSDIKPNQTAIHQTKVNDYATRLKAGEKLPPVEVYEVPGKGMYISEGHHRYAASQMTGIPVNIKVIPGGGPVGLPNWSNVQWKDFINEGQFWGD